MLVPRRDPLVALSQPFQVVIGWDIDEWRENISRLKVEDGWVGRNRCPERSWWNG